MSGRLPERPSLEYLKKRAKETLHELRAMNQDAKLADAQLAVARQHGFSSWRELKTEIQRRRAPRVAAFFAACKSGDVDVLRTMLADDASLVRERDAAGILPLHHAARHPAAVGLLLGHGADPNVRDLSDNATPLHVAAANRCLESVRLLLDAGADPQGTGDVHKGDVIGWATSEGNEAVIDLLLERGARHHIFSAMALGDLELVERLVDEDPACLLRRRSSFENGNTPLHDVIAPPEPWRRPNHAMLARLIELGADLDATDDKGRTPLALAMLRGDQQAIRLLRAAGAKEPKQDSSSADSAGALSDSIKSAVPMFFVQDMRATVQWYESIGFGVRDQFERDGELVFAELYLGNAQFTLSPGGSPGPRDVRLWFMGDRVQDLYRVLRNRQLRAASESCSDAQIQFEEDLYTPFYGGRQFSIRDNNGLTLVFWQQE